MSNDQRRFISLRVEWPTDTDESTAVKLGDQLTTYAATLGDAYIEDEGIMDATDSEGAPSHA